MANVKPEFVDGSEITVNQEPGTAYPRELPDATKAFNIIPTLVLARSRSLWVGDQFRVKLLRGNADPQIQNTIPCQPIRWHADF